VVGSRCPTEQISAQNRLLIKNGKIVNEDGMVDGDVYVEDGIIKQLGRNLIIPGGTRIIDARGKYVIPGGIDPHTHLQFEFMGAVSQDDFYQGTKAALAGGTTMIIDFAIPKKGESLIEAYENWRQKADEKVCCDYGLHVAVTWWSDKVKEEMELLCKDHGVNSFKVFMAYKDSMMLRDNELYGVFDKCRQLGAIAQVHAENGDIIDENTKKLLANGVTGPEGHALSRPEDVEAEATNRACVIANQVSCPLYVVHVMSKSAGSAIESAQSRGYQVFGEVIAAAVGTDGSHYKHSSWRHAANYIMSPPLRDDPSTQEALVDFLVNKKLNIIQSDETAFYKKKEQKFGSSIMTRLPPGQHNMNDCKTHSEENLCSATLINPCEACTISFENFWTFFHDLPGRGGPVPIQCHPDRVIWRTLLQRSTFAKTQLTTQNNDVSQQQNVPSQQSYWIIPSLICPDGTSHHVHNSQSRELSL
ncbi:hypothetical protein L9F63_024575, partial [Diploptera punctata]